MIRIYYHNGKQLFQLYSLALSLCLSLRALFTIYIYISIYNTRNLNDCRTNELGKHEIEMKPRKNYKLKSESNQI